MNDEFNGQGGCYTLDKNGNRVPVATPTVGQDSAMATPVSGSSDAKPAKTNPPTE